MKYLNLGCGGAPLPAPWVNIDRTRGTKQFPCHPDVVADILHLPYADGCAERVYCGHVFQHIALDDVPVALAEVRRVLAPGGKVCIVGPASERFDPDWSEWRPDVGGADRGGHELQTRWCWSTAETLDLIREIFPDAVEVALDDLDALWPTARWLAWQFAIEADA
jgi:predicted SAM-dependent methyltransferase